MTSSSDERPVRLGRLVAAHGIRGEVKVQAYNDQPDGLIVPRQVRLVHDDGRTLPAAVLGGRLLTHGAIVRLAGVQDRNAAEALIGFAIEVQRGTLTPLTEDEYYWHDLFGLTVRTEGGSELGRVVGLQATGAHDVLFLDGGGRTYLLPYVAAFIVRQDDEEIVVRLPPGLLDIND